MNITETRVKIMGNGKGNLLAFCQITLDDSFIIRDLKVINGKSGIFVAMPSRKLEDHCPRCDTRNHLRANFCNECGERLPENRANNTPESKAKIYADIAHPLTTGCRTYIQRMILRVYEEEKELSLQPGYVCKYDEY